MNREEFLNALKTYLGALSPNEVADILRDQDEYIREAILAGRSERDLVDSLGDPKVFAQNLIAISKIEQAEKSTNFQQRSKKTFEATIAILALAPLNLIFVLGPFIGLVAIILGCWVTSTSFIGVAILFFGVFLFKLLAVAVGITTHLAALFFIFGCLGVGIIGILVMYKISGLFISATLTYLRWNIDFIKTRK